MFRSDKLGTIESIVNCELKLVSKWLRLNKFSLNAGKTELMFFRSKQYSLDYNDISIKVNGVKLIPVDYVKYLGFIYRCNVWGLTSEKNLTKIEIFQRDLFANNLIYPN